MRLLTGLWRAALRHRAISIGATVVVLAVVLPVAYYLFSPLFIRTTLQEASPLDVAASIAPSGASGGASVAPSASTATSTPAAAAKSTAAAAAPGTPAASPAPSSSAASPATSPAPPAASTPAAGPRLIARGMFAGADDFHFGRGDALLIEVSPQRHTLRFENFSVRNGPDLFVYLSDDAAGYGATVLKLGPLRATDGAFNYDIPPGTDVTRFRSAIVWCDQFSTLFATAPLK